jgi:uncharacterized protein (DUF488 family)
MVADLGAVLVDIRFTPYSGHPHFRKAALEDTFGDRYVHLRDLGNRNYKGEGPVELVDYEAGRAALEALDRPALLMCGCKDPTHCHRTVILARLAADGFDTQEYRLGNNDTNHPQQLALW